MFPSETTASKDSIRFPLYHAVTQTPLHSHVTQIPLHALTSVPLYKEKNEDEKMEDGAAAAPIAVLAEARTSKADGAAAAPIR